MDSPFDAAVTINHSRGLQRLLPQTIMMSATVCAKRPSQAGATVPHNHLHLSKTLR